jgi:hypothetical protein
MDSEIEFDEKKNAINLAKRSFGNPYGHWGRRP